MTLAAVLRALALGFSNAADIAEADAGEAPAKPAKPAKAAKAAPAAESAPAAAPAAAPVAEAPPAPPAAEPISKVKLNKAVLAVAGVNRDAAIKILAKHGASNTATLPIEKYQAVFDDFEEEKARLDAEAAKASLV